LERIAQPSLPDAALEPRRMRSILSIFVAGLVAWGVLSMLLAGVREHKD
jgi:capsular polysaccharide transport system permease protein